MDTRDSITKQILAGTFDRNRSIKRLRADGMTYKAIGSFYGLSKQRVHKIATNPFGNSPVEPPQTHQNEHRGGFIARLKEWVSKWLRKEIQV